MQSHSKPSLSSKKKSFSRRGTSSGPSSIDGGTRKGSDTETHAESRAFSGTNSRSGKGILPGSEYQKIVSSTSRRRTIAPLLPSTISATSPPSSDTDILPIKVNRHPQNVPKHKTVEPSDCNFLKTKRASSDVMGSIITPPWVSAFIQWFSERIDRKIPHLHGSFTPAAARPSPKHGLTRSQPSLVSRAALSESGRSYTKRSAKTKRPSGSPASSRRRS